MERNMERGHPCPQLNARVRTKKAAFIRGFFRTR
jgi:hypothetical protein